MTIVTSIVNNWREIFHWGMQARVNSISPLLTLLGQRGNDTPRTSVKSSSGTCHIPLPGASARRPYR
jgi:hypothetical protein